MRGALVLVALLASMPGCCLRKVPAEQAARDLGCAAEAVHVSLGWRSQIAEGCGRSVTYVEVCGDDLKQCRFEAVRSWALRGERGYDLDSAMP